jgi:hypothetical protein
VVAEGVTHLFVADEWRVALTPPCRLSRLSLIGEVRRGWRTSPAMTGKWLLARQRPRVAHAPAGGLHQRDEAFDHFVEQCRFFQIEHVA